MSGVRKAAILISMLGDEAAAAIYRLISEDDLQKLTDEIARLGTVREEVAVQVLDEYWQLLAAQEHIAQGGHDVATRLLVSAFGEMGAKDMVQRLARSQEADFSRIEPLRRIEPKQLARVLEGEHPQTIAIALGLLEAKHAAAVLVFLPQGLRADVVRRLANLRNASSKIIEKVVVVLNRKFQSASERRKTYSGFQSAADLMNNLDGTTSGEILEAIEVEEGELAVRIRDLMFTFEDFLKIPAAQLRTVCGTADKTTLTMALKGASEELKNHFYATMSSRAVEIMKEDAEVMGAVRGKEVSKAQLEIVAVARKLEMEGKIVLRVDDSEYVS
jgi:flagellar motor switch protein FliG